MRISTVIFTLLLSGCTLVGQQPNEIVKKEVEFIELMKKIKVTQEVNKQSIQAADKKTSEKITKTANQIVSLKAEVKQLKSELNETNKKLDSINSDTGVKFRFSAIPNGEKDR